MSEPIKDVSAEQFEAEVLKRSHEKPVVVDFWAAWCAPCRALAPVLEREIAALGGRVELAKVDVDAEVNERLSADYDIRGIPAVKAFREGKVVAQFEGARDAAFIRAWLAGIAPSPARLALEAAEKKLEAGDLSGEPELRALLGDAEIANRAALTLAKLLLARGDAAGAEEALKHIDPRSVEADAIPTLERRIGFVRDAEAFGGEEKARAAVEDDPENLEARYALGCALAAKGELEAALEAFLSVVSKSRKFRDDAARLAMLAIFEQLGSDSDLARTWRRKLMIAL